jgi:2-dehydropantoate 2-reductase
MNVIVIGIGALGCLFAGRLSPHAAVTMLGHWPEQVQALRAKGLTMIDPAGETSMIPVRVVTKPAGLPPADLALVLVKSYQTARAAAQAATVLGEKGVALTLQNGIGNQETLAAAVGAGRAFVGTTSEGANIVRPGVVRHAGYGETYLGGAAMQRVAGLFQAAGFRTELVDNVDGLLWGKLAVNAGINPLTALLRVPNGYLAENPAAQALMVAAAQETAAVAQAQGISLPYADAGQQALNVAQATAANQSSMLQDVQNGRQTEIEAITGAVVHAGRAAGVPTPVNSLLLQMAKANFPNDRIA